MSRRRGFNLKRSYIQTLISTIYGHQMWGRHTFNQNVPLLRPRRLPTISTSFVPGFTLVWNTPTSLSMSAPVSTSRTTTDKVAVEGTVFTIQVSSQTGKRVFCLTDDLHKSRPVSHNKQTGKHSRVRNLVIKCSTKTRVHRANNMHPRKIRRPNKLQNLFICTQRTSSKRTPTLITRSTYLVSTLNSSASSTALKWLTDLTLALCGVW